MKDTDAISSIFISILVCVSCPSPRGRTGGQGSRPSRCHRTGTRCPCSPTGPPRRHLSGPVGAQHRPLAPLSRCAQRNPSGDLFPAREQLWAPGGPRALREAPEGTAAPPCASSCRRQPLAEPGTPQPPRRGSRGPALPEAAGPGAAGAGNGTHR